VCGVEEPTAPIRRPPIARERRAPLTPSLGDRRQPQIARPVEHRHYEYDDLPAPQPRHRRLQIPAGPQRTPIADPSAGKTML
jgi:hypothetical protein